MAIGDLKDYEISAGNYGTTETLTWNVSPAEDDLLIVMLTSQNERSVSTMTPNDYTSYEADAGFPSIHVYAKIAGASEGTTVNWTTDINDNLYNMGVMIEGPLTLSNLSFGGVTRSGSVETDDNPDSAMSTTGGLAIALGILYQIRTVSVDNSFTIQEQNAFDYQKYIATRVFTGSSSDVQTTVSWTSGTNHNGTMALVEFGGTSVPVMMNHYRRMRG